MRLRFLGAVGTEREKAGGLPDSTEEGRVCAAPSRLHQGPDSQTDVKFPDLLHATTGTPDCEAYRKASACSLVLSNSL